MDSFFVQSFMYTKAPYPPKQMDENLTENLLWHVKKMFGKKCLKYGIPKRKIYPHVILWIYDSSLCLGMGECLFLFATFQSDSCCLSISSPYPQDPPIFQMSTPPMENSEPYIHACVSDLPLS